jgi:DNA-binding transcriptional ArsR family regulator
MLRLDLGPDQLAATRFACSALQETVASLRVLDDPTSHTMHLPWYREVAGRAARLDLGLLRALVPAKGYSPDFISPPPDSPLPDLDADLARVAATPPERIRAEIAEMFGSDPPPGPARLLADPATGLQTVVAQLRGWFDAALADHWPRIRALLQADISYRARCLSTGGTRALFGDLHPSVRWHEGGRLDLAIAYEAPVALDDRGLLLVPSVFAWPGIYVVSDPPWQPTLIYPARGTATAWEPTREPAPDALRRLVGSTRAAILLALQTPHTGADLARVLEVTAGAVSQHLTVLRDAGLVATHRDGRHVIAQRTELGDRFCQS